MTELTFIYRKPDDGNTTAEIRTTGPMGNVCIAIGRLIQNIYNQTPEQLKPIFRAAMQAMTDDESPFWKPDEGAVTIDMNALRGGGKK